MECQYIGAHAGRIVNKQLEFLLKTVGIVCLLLV